MHKQVCVREREGFEKRYIMLEFHGFTEQVVAKR